MSENGNGWNRKVFLTRLSETAIIALVVSGINYGVVVTKLSYLEGLLRDHLAVPAHSSALDRLARIETNIEHILRAANADDHP